MRTLLLVSCFSFITCMQYESHIAWHDAFKLKIIEEKWQQFCSAFSKQVLQLNLGGNCLEQYTYLSQMEWQQNNLFTLKKWHQELHLIPNSAKTVFLSQIVELLPEVSTASPFAHRCAHHWCNKILKKYRDYIVYVKKLPVTPESFGLFCDATEKFIAYGASGPVYSWVTAY